MKEKRLHIQVLYESDNISECENFKNYAALTSNLFTFYLPPVLINKTQKLVIEFSESEDVFFIYPAKLGESIYTIQHTFPCSDFGKSSLLEKIKLLAEQVYFCLLKLYEHLKLEVGGLTDGYNLILKNNYKLSLKLCGGLKQNKDKTLGAVVSAEHFLDGTIIQVTFLSKNKKVVHVMQLFKTLPNSLFYTQLARTAKWIDQEVFQVTNNSKEFNIQINVSGSHTVVYSPRERGIEGIKEEINFFTQDVFIDL